jgi:hypothetical protein
MLQALGPKLDPAGPAALDESFHIDGSLVQQWRQDRLFGRFRKFLEVTFEAGGPAHDQELCALMCWFSVKWGASVRWSAYMHRQWLVAIRLFGAGRTFEAHYSAAEGYGTTAYPRLVLAEVGFGYTISVSALFCDPPSR